MWYNHLGKSEFVEETIWDIISHAQNLMNAIVSSMNTLKPSNMKSAFRDIYRLLRRVIRWQSARLAISTMMVWA